MERLSLVPVISFPEGLDCCRLVSAYRLQPDGGRASRPRSAASSSRLATADNSPSRSLRNHGSPSLACSKDAAEPRQEAVAFFRASRSTCSFVSSKDVLRTTPP